MKNVIYKKNELLKEYWMSKFLITGLFLISFILLNGNVLAQQSASDNTIKGQIVDNEGEPIIGASIQLKDDTSIGTVTDTEGNFALKVPSGSILIIRYVGFTTLEYPLKTGEKEIKIVLEQDARLIDELVVVGYGTQKKVNLTGSVSSIDISKEVKSRPITNLSSGLAGLSSGVYVQSGNNVPGSDNAGILIRGQGTLNNSSPLIIIDGVERNIGNINPQDVATISILKDAASSAIYGSRAANGVILITTKQGSKEKLNISYDGYFSRQSIAHTMNLVDNSVQYMELQNEAAKNSNIKPPFSVANIENWREHQNDDPLLYPNTNWQDAAFRSVNTYNHNLSISGGNEKMTSFISLNYMNNPGILENTGYKKINLRSNIQTNISKWLQIGVNLDGLVGKKEPGQVMLSSMFTNSVGAVPTVVVRSPDGRYGGNNNPEGNLGAASPLWYLNVRKGNDITHSIFSRLYTSISPIEGLKVNASYNYSYFDNKYSRQQRIVPRWDFLRDIVLSTGEERLQISNTDSQHFLVFMDANAQYEKTLFEKLNTRIMLGSSQEKSRSEWFTGARLDLVSEHLSVLDGAIGPSEATGNDSEWVMHSYFGRLNLNWDEKYLLEFNLRRDGSSRFLGENRWGNFPSISAGWNISEEAFMRTAKEQWLDRLKVRLSYGSLGNNAVGNYQAISTLGLSNYVLNGTVNEGYAILSLANAGLTWESTYILNGGLDFTLWKNKIDGSLDIYDKTTKGILISLPAPLVHGYAGIPPQNAAKVQNRGADFNLTFRDNIRDFNYSIGLNLTYNKNKVLKFKGDEHSLSGSSMIKEGLPINVQYVHLVDRIIQNEGDLKIVQEMIDNAPADPNNAEVKQNPFPFGTPELGDFLYKDVNGDGIINDDDRTTIGNGLNPNIIYGLNLNAQYKMFDFSCLLQGVSGLKQFYLDPYFTPNLQQNIIINKDIAIGRYYTGRPTPAIYPRILMGDTRNTKYSDAWVQDKSYFKIRNIQLGFSVPPQILSKANISQLRLYVSLENYFTFTKYKGLDPEVSGTAYPTMKQIIGGINLTF